MSVHPGAAARERGAVLIELIIAAAVSAIVIAGALSLLVSQHRAFRAFSDDRVLQESARFAMEHVTTNLRQAGFGIDPAFGFDFGAYSKLRMSLAPPESVVATTEFGCTTPVTCRDRVDGPDELVFLSRDPGFGHAIAAAPSATELTIKGPLNSPLYAGQILQLLCYSGGMYWAYVTVDAFHDRTTNADDVVLKIKAGGQDFPVQNGFIAGSGSNTCFSTVAPDDQATRVFKVDRYRYHVASYDTAGNVVAWGTGGSRPYLMLDQGLKDKDGNAAESVVAPDVEDMQVAYLFPRAAAAQLVGGGASGKTAGARLASDAASIDLVDTTLGPAISDPQSSGARTTHHPGNIGAVRVSFVVRSVAFDARALLATDEERTLKASGNRPEQLGPAGFRRLLVGSTITTRNMNPAAPYYPTYSAGPDQLNVGGG